MTDEQVHEMVESMINMRKACIEPSEDGKSGTWIRHLPREFYRLQDALAEEFGNRHGWKTSKNPSRIHPSQLGRRSPRRKQDEWDFGDSTTMDHPYYYREKEHPYRPAAIVVHLYDVYEEKIQEVCARHNIRYEVEPSTGFPSWWFPEWTTLVTYTPITLQ